MSAHTPNQRGFGVIGLVLVLIAVGLIAFAGFSVASINKTDGAATATTPTVTIPETINSQSDLRQTDAALDAADTELDSNLDDSKLDADINSML